MKRIVEPYLAGPWPPAAELLQAELDGYLGAADDPAVAGLPTRCSPWTVHDLTAHLAMTFKRFVRMLEQSRAGDLSPPFAPGDLAAENLRAVAAFTGDPRAELRRWAAALLAAATDPQEPVAHQFGPIPVGLQLLFGLAAARPAWPATGPAGRCRCLRGAMTFVTSLADR